MDDRRPAQAGAQNPAYRPAHPHINSLTCSGSPVPRSIASSLRTTFRRVRTFRLGCPNAAPRDLPALVTRLKVAVWGDQAPFIAENSLTSAATAQDHQGRKGGVLMNKRHWRNMGQYVLWSLLFI